MRQAGPEPVAGREVRAVQGASLAGIEPLAEVLRIGLLVCAGAVLDPLRLHIVGQSNLARTLAGDPELAATLALLEDYQRLAELLFRLVPDGPHARVHVGAIAQHEGPEADVGVLALVGCRLPVGSRNEQSARAAGAIAVLGPRRMDFAAIVPLVEYAARALAARMCA